MISSLVVALDNDLTRYTIGGLCRGNLDTVAMGKLIEGARRWR
jgi:hypothetical protein